MKTGASDAPSQFAQRIALLRPSIPLASSHLLINGPRDHTVNSEIKRELASADRVDLLVSFLKWSGWRLLRDEARRFLDRHPGGLRVLTTTYLGATDRKEILDQSLATFRVALKDNTFGDHSSQTLSVV